MWKCRVAKAVGAVVEVVTAAAVDVEVTEVVATAGGKLLDFFIFDM